MEEIKLTPMIRQYLEIKERHRDAILFFRLGDFYEMFFEDAEVASRILDIALTTRNRGDEGAVPLCGVPYHAAGPYIGKLLGAGYKVAICEQLEDPKAARGVVRRGVVRVVTPGTVTDGEALEPTSNNFLAAVARDRQGWGLALADVTTGEFRFTGLADASALIEELGRAQPAELLVPSGAAELRERLARDFPSLHLTALADFYFRGEALARWGKTAQSGAAGGWELGLRAAAAIASYLEEKLPEALRVLAEPEPYRASRYAMIDEVSRRNLELVRDLQGQRQGSLLAVLDHTVTPMGARCLKQWILYPLLDERAIRDRLDSVEELSEDFRARHELAQALRAVQDLERLASRAATGSASPRDLAALRAGLLAVPSIRALALRARSARLRALAAELAELPEVADLIGRALVDDPPAGPRAAGAIRPGYSAELDELRELRSHAKEWIARFEKRERERTGIGSLKVRYNRVFGYYIEVSRANLKLVPPDYSRKQTLAGAERFVTPELKEYEAKVLTSEEEIGKLEQRLFEELREKVAARYRELRATGRALAVLDALLSLSEAALRRHFVRPQVDSGYVIAVKEGRHPVVEAAAGGSGFVANDCELDPDGAQIVVLTGPNMSGKSTYMRQVALIVLLAQMGSFVPAAAARVGLVDRIFTRIGASDALARGESTFMVEMREVASILRQVTPRSLILLDEVGRGTSTFDGISIAWSVAEFLHDHPSRPRTLFATHYHELADLALTKERVRNFTFAVKEWKGEVLFLRTLLEGASNRSYGIQVARLAGLPPAVLERAKEILRHLEGAELDRSGRPRLAPERGTAPAQMPLFSDAGEALRQELAALCPEAMTPLEALNTLSELVERARKEA